MTVCYDLRRQIAILNFRNEFDLQNDLFPNSSVVLLIFRRYNEFFVLQSKLKEFHGRFGFHHVYLSAKKTARSTLEPKFLSRFILKNSLLCSP